MFIPLCMHKKTAVLQIGLPHLKNYCPLTSIFLVQLLPLPLPVYWDLSAADSEFSLFLVPLLL